MTGKRMLITGASGYIALHLIKRWLSESNTTVILWLHARSQAELMQKRRVLERRFQPFHGRVEYCGGDLAATQPFADVDPHAVDVVVHAAAVTRFNVEVELAHRINIEGSNKLFRFCERCPRLDRLAYVSTVYSSGLRPGLIDEVALDDSYGFANHYEGSKWAAETMLLTQYQHLPWQIFRVATVIAEGVDGTVRQMNVVHNTLKLLYYGLLPVLPGAPGTPLYFVTGQFVTDAISNLLSHAPVRMIYHVAHTREESLELDELIDMAFHAFDRSAAFRRRRVLPPPYVDQPSFAHLTENVQDFGGPVMKQALASMTPFSRQLFLHKEVKNMRLVSHLPIYQAPDLRRVITAVCDSLVQTRWGLAVPELVAV